MLKNIRILNLGPHADFRAELDPRGHNTVSGPSEAGKSFLVEAVLFTLYGKSTAGRFRPEAITDGSSRALVELTLDSGMTLRRTCTRTRSTTRTIVLGNDETAYSSEAKFAEALGELGADPEAVGIVVQPMAWQDLAMGNARKLRDLLARILPSVGIEGVIQQLVTDAGHEVSAADAGLSDSQANSRRREVRKLRDEASGRLQLAQERLSTHLDATQMAVEELAPDPELRARVEAWEAYDSATRTQARAAADKERAADWDRRRTALGEEPSIEPFDTAGFATLQQTAQQLAGQQQMLTMQRQMFTGGDVCPTCQRPGWEHGTAMAGNLDTQLATLAEQMTATSTQWQSAQALQAIHQRQSAEQQAWKRSLQGLGKRPAEPDDVDLPTPPDCERPDATQVEEMRVRISRAAAAEGLRTQQERDLKQAGDSAKAELERLELAEAEATRWDAIVDAIRKAPSMVAAEQARALGDLGPVTLEFDENPAVSVLIDGRPWWLASRGRQVVADAMFRNALRKAMDMPHLPLFVDNTQDVGGQPLPDVPGPVVWLQTNDSKGIFVRRKTHKPDTSL